MQETNAVHVSSPLVTDGCSSVSKLDSSIYKLSIKNLSCRATWLSFIGMKEGGKGLRV